MKLVRVAAAAVNQTPLDWAGNLRRILRAVEMARADKVSVLCLPELCITGYGCEDAFFSTDVTRRAIDSLRQVAAASAGMIVSVGLPLRYRNSLLNGTAMLANGEILGFVAKRNLAGDGIHYEPRWFKPWRDTGSNTIELAWTAAGEEEYPVGNLLFEFGDVRVGYEICEDAWVADRPGSALAADAVDIILNPSASHFAFGKLAVRERLVVEGSRAFAATYIYANLLGNEAGRIIYDGGALIASGGRLVAQGPRFSLDEVVVTAATIDIDATRTIQTRTASFEPNLGHPTHRVIETKFQFPVVEPQVNAPKPAAWETAGHLKEEEFTRALTLGLFDYMRKSRSQGFVVSLSGGADSTAVACLVRMMVQRAVNELGMEETYRRLAYIKDVATLNTADALTGRLLTTVYQATRNSGEVTRQAAAVVAAAIHSQHLELDVEALHSGYVNLISEALGRPLDWSTDDLALQNIQARTRGPSVWLLANLRNALLVSTSNRSEAAVGYATMDGDTCGGLSPIAGIDKNYLRRWLVWLEKQGPEGLGPIAAVRVVNDQQPTAELRPAAMTQTDEADLMPYDVLDAVERAAIRDKLAPREILRVLRGEFPRYDARQLAAWIERFFRLWCRNQWKRERYAPSFHVDDENLDPKSWCRFPILSGGYEAELAELRAEV
ncbi:MAG: NAD(+) synthase [Bryobacterales bacterium]|nr:NAD(+) synthase [Bryobacterales bacterium]